MPSLENLPNELLRQILCELKEEPQTARSDSIYHLNKRKDLYAVCLTCHRLLPPAQELLYATYIVASPNANWTLWPFLRTVVTLPSLATHVKFIYLHFYDPDCSDGYPYLDHHQFTPTDKVLIKTLHQRLGLQYRRLWQHVRRFNTLHELLVALILLLLPNVETVYLSIPPAAPVLMHCLFHCAVSRLPDSPSPPCSSSSARSDVLHFANNTSGLSSLMPLPLWLVSRGYQCYRLEGGIGRAGGFLNHVTALTFIQPSVRSNLSALIPFLLLPKLQNLGTSALHAPVGEGFSLPLPPPPSNPPGSGCPISSISYRSSSAPNIAQLSSLDLGSSHIDGSELAPLLSPLRHSIQGFFYAFDAFPPQYRGVLDGDVGFDIPRLDSALAQLADRLLLLDLRAAPPLLQAMVARGAGAVLDCLPRFRQLTHLTTCLQLLVGAAVTRELSEMLPRSLRMVEFVDMKSEEYGEITLRGWFERHWPILLLQFTEVVAGGKSMGGLEPAMGRLDLLGQQHQSHRQASTSSPSFPHLESLGMLDLDMLRRLRWEGTSGLKQDRNPIWAALVQACRDEGVALAGTEVTGRALDLRWTDNERGSEGNVDRERHDRRG